MTFLRVKRRHGHRLTCEQIGASDWRLLHTLWRHVHIVGAAKKPKLINRANAKR